MKQFESIRLDIVNECLWRDGVQLSLPPKPFAVLRYLVEHPARLITHDELLDALWPDTYVQPQVLRTYVQELRKVLGDDACHPRFIQTLPKRGYCFVAQLTDCDSETPSVISKIDRSRPTKTKLFGREMELDQLCEISRKWLASTRQVVFVTGETGIGKTALVDEFCHQIATQTAVVVGRGQCVAAVAAYEEYYPVQEALGQLCSSPQGPVVLHTLASLAPAWLRGSGANLDNSTSSATSTPAMTPSRTPTITELCNALDELSSHNPILLVLEDLQWADRSTLQLIAAISKRRAAARLMLILTYSEQNGRKEHFLKGMKQELLVHRQCAEIVLTPLSKRAIVQMLTAELQVGLEKNNSKHLESDDAPTAVEQCVTMDLASFVHRHSEGNPLFALAIMDHLKHQGILVRKRSANTYCWESRIPFEEIKSIVPEGLAQMIELEVQTLPPKEQRLLEAGSLMTIAFPAWVVAAALNEDPQSIEDACDQLSRQLHFLNRIGQDELPDGTSSDVYIFTHGLYREVLYQRQSASRRARRHIRIAARLSEIFADREGNVAREIALHYEAASNWPRAVDLQLQAARHARDRQAPWESVQLLEHALRLAENLCEPERKQALLTVRNELSISREAMHSGSLQQISASS